jgi:hypothetical protein
MVEVKQICVIFRDYVSIIMLSSHQQKESKNRFDFGKMLEKAKDTFEKMVLIFCLKNTPKFFQEIGSKIT